MTNWHMSLSLSVALKASAIDLHLASTIRPLAHMNEVSHSGGVSAPRSD